jgi:lipoprotein-anchoring transpeptidase ErfK/SrfK
MSSSFFRGPITPKLLHAALVILLLSISLALASCGSISPSQQQAIQSQASFEQLLQQAKLAGVPSSTLQPVLLQQQQLGTVQPPLTLFNTQSANDYYQNIATRYTQLRLQLQSITSIFTQGVQSQAQHDLQALQILLAQQRTLGLPVQNFSQQLQHSQQAFLHAITPIDFAQISSQAHTTSQALNFLPTVSARLKQLQTMITQMQSAHMDVNWLQTQDQDDLKLLTAANTTSDIQRVYTLVDGQYQLAIVHSTLALPFVTASKLQELTTKITFLKTYGVDTSAYQQRVNADQAQISKVKTIQDYTIFSKQVDADINAMQADAVPAQARYLVNQFHQEVQKWGQAHLYHDTFDGNNYPLNAGYMQQGIGSDLDSALNSAVTTADFQDVVSLANNDLFNLHLFETDYADKTSFDQPHKTDQQALQQYGLLTRQVIVVSLADQAMRIYQNGALVHSLQVTTGRPELPSLPGVWSVQDRLSPTTFTSSEPPGSPYWYPPTPIHFAIEYHLGGYFIHDSWWRADYGPGTQFPHVDSGGDQSFSGDGSHGCINVPLDQADWIYNHTDWNTAIVVY